MSAERRPGRAFVRVVPGNVFARDGWPWIVVETKDETPPHHPGYKQYGIFLRTVYPDGTQEYTRTTQEYIFSERSEWVERR